jgi:hypothetical protein
MIRTLLPVLVALPTGFGVGYWSALVSVRAMIQRGELVSSSTLRRLAKDRERRA